MNVAIVYVHPRMNVRTYIPAARRFAQSYMANPPGGTPHSLHVVVNGDEHARQNDANLFKPLPVTFYAHDNWGKDIGAFQKAAREIKGYDLMVFCGAHVHFRHPGWLDVMVNAYERNGPGIYGAYAFHQPNWHIRTTCFWMPPDLLNAYPHAVHNDFRYEFEHGATHSIVRWVIDSGFNAWMVTWRGTYPPDSWRHVENSEALALDQHSDRLGYT